MSRPTTTALDPAELAQLAPEDMARVTLRPHATARWTWCDEHPIYTLWSRNRDPGANFDAEFEWRGEGVLLTRPHGAVNTSGCRAPALPSFRPAPRA